ncbi:hypothetical protein Hanom_Chr06g00535671 [Helianthus anomalus]
MVILIERIWPPNMPNQDPSTHANCMCFNWTKMCLGRPSNQEASNNEKCMQSHWTTLVLGRGGGPPLYLKESIFF